MSSEIPNYNFVCRINIVRIAIFKPDFWEITNSFLYRYPTRFSILEVRLFRENKLHPIRYIPPLTNDNYTFTMLRYAIVSHIHFMDFDEIAGIGKILYYLPYYLTFFKAKNTLNILSNKIAWLFYFNDALKKQVQLISFISNISS